MADQDTVAVAAKKKPTEAQKKLATKLARELHRIDFASETDAKAEAGATLHEERRKAFAGQRTAYFRKARQLMRRLEVTGVTLGLEPEAKKTK